MYKKKKNTGKTKGEMGNIRIFSNIGLHTKNLRQFSAFVVVVEKIFDEYIDDFHYFQKCVFSQRKPTTHFGGTSFFRRKVTSCYMFIVHSSRNSKRTCEYSSSSGSKKRRKDREEHRNMLWLRTSVHCGCLRSDRLPALALRTSCAPPPSPPAAPTVLLCGGRHQRGAVQCDRLPLVAQPRAQP